MKAPARRRVYLPASPTLLGQWLAQGRVPAAQVAATVGAFAVTDRLRDFLPEADQEELEYQAMLAAGEAALHLIVHGLGGAATGGSQTGPAEPAEAVQAAPRRSQGWRRVVLAMDASAVTDPDPNSHPASVLLDGATPVSDLISAQVDDEASRPVLAAALDVLAGGAETGVDEALDRVGEHALMWFDRTELAQVARLPG
ncbi:MAG: DUF6912 family protein [Actinomycetales bacterium]